MDCAKVSLPLARELVDPIPLLDKAFGQRIHDVAQAVQVLGRGWLPLTELPVVLDEQLECNFNPVKTIRVLRPLSPV